MNTIKIEDYPSHWKATLLGEAFWKEAERLNQSSNDSIEANHDQTLHTKFPFNLGPETSAHFTTSATENVPEKKQRRRFSMSDAMSLNVFSSYAPTFPPQTRFFASGKRTQSPSPSGTRSPSIASETRRRHSILRSPFNLAISKRNQSIESVLSIPPPQEPGTPEKPLMYFRGGASWTCLPRDMEKLGLDLFWPVINEDQDFEKDMLIIEEMAPLCHFRNLRVLKVTGMLQSYQLYIWEAAWLNTNLEELELGMALEPWIRPNFAGNWSYIRNGWKLNMEHYREPVYYGLEFEGKGNLDSEIGFGEYLDKKAIEKAKVRAMAVGRTLHRLSIKKLTLAGFVVDADPFLLWFDAKRLECINFKNDCIDAGFYLCDPMKRTKILFPRNVREKLVRYRRVDLSTEGKIIDLKCVKKVGGMPYLDPTTFRQNMYSNDRKKQAERNANKTDGNFRRSDNRGCRGIGDKQYLRN